MCVEPVLFTCDTEVIPLYVRVRIFIDVCMRATFVNVYTFEMCIYIHIYIYIHMHTYMYTDALWIHVCMCVGVRHDSSMWALTYDTTHWCARWCGTCGVRHESWILMNHGYEWIMDMISHGRHESRMRTSMSHVTRVKHTEWESWAEHILSILMFFVNKKRHALPHSWRNWTASWKERSTSSGTCSRLLMLRYYICTHTRTHTPTHTHTHTHTHARTLTHACIHTRKGVCLAEYVFWWILQHCTGFARLVWGRLRVHLSFHLFCRRVYRALALAPALSLFPPFFLLCDYDFDFDLDFRCLCLQ